MKVWQKRMWPTAAAVASLLALSITFVPQVGMASAASTIPAMPVAGSSLATWQSWASAQQTALQSVSPLSLVTPSAGCTVASVTLIPTVSSGTPGFPAGIVTDAVQVVGSCGNATAGGVHPLISEHFPNMDDCTYQAANLAKASQVVTIYSQ